MRPGRVLVALIFFALAWSLVFLSLTCSSSDPKPLASAGAPIVTNLYDNGRSGATTHETTLTTSNVGRATFGLQFSRAIDGFIYGHVLYMPKLTINKAKHNVIFAATEANMVYAFDADDPKAEDPLWTKMLGAPMPLGAALMLPDGTMVQAPPGYPSCQDLKPSGRVGITSTPVIDPASRTLYVVSKTRESQGDQQTLHALDLLTGDERGTPVRIAAPGFMPTLHLNRPGLLLQDGVIYIGFGSHCDDRKELYHGWIFADDATTLEQRGFYNTTPTGQAAAIWQSGVGLTGDGNGGVLAATGNGTTSKGGTMTGMGGMAGGMAGAGGTAMPATEDDGTNMIFSVIRVKLGDTGLGLANYFFPPNTAALGMRDLDLATGVHLLPGGGAIAGGKEGMIYQLDDDLKPRADAFKVEVNPDSKRNSVLHMLAVWTGPSGLSVFTWPTGGGLTSIKLTDGLIDPKSVKSNTLRTPAHPGGSISISSNGTKAGTGIVWATIPALGDSWHDTAEGELLAFDAGDVSKVLWRSSEPGVTDNTLGKYAKFSPPVVANGRVYVATHDPKIMVYGLQP